MQQDAAREMLVSAVSGAMATGSAKTLLFPIESLKMWFINKRGDETLKDILAKWWKSGLYVGYPAKTTKDVVQKFIFFYLFEGIISFALRLTNASRRSRSLAPTAEASFFVLILGGYLGEVLGIPVFAPLEYLASQTQTSKTREGVVSVCQRTMRESGVAGFYPGWKVYFLCAFQPMIKQSFIETTRAALLRGQDRRTAHLSASAAFRLGALAQVIAGTFVYPINVGRIAVQASRKSESTDGNGASSEQETNIFKVMARIKREQGVKGLYNGLTANIAQGMLGSAIELTVKETVTAGVRSVVYSGAKA